MQTKRRILGIVSSTVVSTLLVAAAVYATSTIGDDITVGDDLTVTDALTVTGKAKIGTDTSTNAISLVNTAGSDFGLETYTKLASDMAGGWYAGSNSYMTMTVTQTGDTSVFGSISELDLPTGTTFSSSNAGAMWADLEMLGTVNLGESAEATPSYSGAVIATLVSSTTGVTVPANRHLAGVVVDSAMTSGYSDSGEVSGIVIRRSTSSKSVWPVGLRIKGSATTTGIDIGAATTGIAFTGAMTTGISVANNLVIPQLMTVGAASNGIHWDGAAENILIYAESLDTGPTEKKTFAKIQLNAATSDNTGAGRLETFRGVVSTSGTKTMAASMRALVGQTEFAGNTTFSGVHPDGAYGVIASIWAADATTLAVTGDLAPLAIYYGIGQNATVTGETSYIYIYNYGWSAPESVMRIYTPSQNGTDATHGVPTYLFDRVATLGNYSDPFTTDSVATNAGASDGAIKVRVGSTVYEIPIFAE